MQTTNTFMKLMRFGDSYIKLHTRLKSFKLRKSTFPIKRRSLDHLKEEVRRTPVPLSFTISNMIVDQKIGKII